MIKSYKIIEQLNEEIKEAIIKRDSNHKRSFVYHYYDGKGKAYREAIEMIKEDCEGW